MTEDDGIKREQGIVRDFWLTIIAVIAFNPVTLIVLLAQIDWEIWVAGMCAQVALATGYALLFMEIEHLKGSDLLAALFMRLSFFGTATLLGWSIAEDSMLIGVAVFLAGCYLSLGIATRINGGNRLGTWFWRARIAHKRLRDWRGR